MDGKHHPMNTVMKRVTDWDARLQTLTIWPARAVCSHLEGGWTTKCPNKFAEIPECCLPVLHSISRSHHLQYGKTELNQYLCTEQNIGVLTNVGKHLSCNGVPWDALEVRGKLLTCLLSSYLICFQRD